MNKFFPYLFALSIVTANATDYVSYDTIGTVPFTVRNIAVINPESLSPAKSLAIIKVHTPVGYGAYGNDTLPNLGIDLSTEAGRLLFSQFEKAYRFQQVIKVRCKATSNNLPPDRVYILAPGESASSGNAIRFWTPVIAWSE